MQFPVTLTLFALFLIISAALNQVLAKPQSLFGLNYNRYNNGYGYSNQQGYGYNSGFNNGYNGYQPYSNGYANGYQPYGLGASNGYGAGSSFNLGLGR